LDNCRGATIPLYVSILIYTIVQNEVLIGANSTIGSILGILGAGLYGIIVNKNNRLKAMLMSVVVVLIPCVIMYFSLGVYTLIAFYAVYNLCNLFVGTPVLNTHFKVMENIEGLEGLGPQIHTVREIFVSIGRIIGYLMIAFIPQTNMGIVIILSVISIFSVVNYFLVKKASKNINKKGENQDA
jgi:MFS family permease